MEQACDATVRTDFTWEGRSLILDPTECIQTMEEVFLSLCFDPSRPMDGVLGKEKNPS